MVSPTEEDKILDPHTEDSSDSEIVDRETPDDSSDSETPKEISTLDLVKNAIEETEIENGGKNNNPEDDEPADESKSIDDDESEDDSDEMTEEDEKEWKKQLNVKTRKRFEQLQGNNRDLNTRLEKAETDAGWKANFDGFLEKNKLSQDEANTLFDIGAAMKNDPHKALKALTPHYNRLLEVTGNILSPELRERVKLGYITEQDARDLSTTRAATRGYEVRDQNNADQRRQDELSQQKQLASDIQTAVADLENSWKKSDPDYNVKSNRVQERVKLAWYEAQQAGQLPRTVDQATRMVEKAKKEVENELRKFMPRKAVKSVESGSNTGQMTPEPSSTLDVIKNTLGI